ncbi:hypothetical protein U27_04010 [Candidatus Vecturithrix granuli]|uniref:Uncharacterized protein n=1 Tax=Vecturithrix granuli TaxID=1499967 RepID=A0A081BXJ1_VECG1|nr:hypothetical protein U27_04010 [Candidatus Vecturithrix granuli]
MSKKQQEKKLLAQIKSRLQKRRQHSAQQQSSMPFPDMLSQPAFADIEAPEGFRVVSMTQGLIEFAQPLMEQLQADGVEDMNIGMNLAVQIWNFAIPKGPIQQTKDDIVEQICAALKLDETDTLDLFEHLLERKAYLFPEEIQPKNSMTMFMRKEVAYSIAKFDEAELALSTEAIPPDQEDQVILDQLRQLDSMVADGEEYDAWESVYFRVEEGCCQRYNEWLIAKGSPAKQCREFPFCIEIFLNFVYRYTARTLCSVEYLDLEDFFTDHVLRKVVIQPNDYVYWPPALRLFYQFLHEKGYLDNSQHFIKMFHEIEPEFLDILKKRY